MAFPVLPYGFGSSLSGYPEVDGYQIKNSAFFGYIAPNPGNINRDWRYDHIMTQGSGFSFQPPIFTAPGIGGGIDLGTDHQTKMTLSFWLKLSGESTYNNGGITRETDPPLQDTDGLSRQILTDVFPEIYSGVVVSETNKRQNEIALTFKQYPPLNNMSLHIRIIKNYQVALDTYGVFTDPTAWYHMLLIFDTTQASASRRVRVYVNGRQIIYHDIDNRGFFIRYSTVPFNTLPDPNQPSSYWRFGHTLWGRVTELYLIRGWAPVFNDQATDFGFIHPLSGRFVAKPFTRDLTGTAPTTLNQPPRKYYLNFSDTSSLDSALQNHGFIAKGAFISDDGPYQLENYAIGYQDNNSAANKTINLYSAVTEMFLPLPDPDTREKDAYGRPIGGVWNYAQGDGRGIDFFEKWFTVTDVPIRRPCQNTFSVYATYWNSEVYRYFTGFRPYYFYIRLNGSTILQVPLGTGQSREIQAPKWHDLAFTGAINKIELAVWYQTVGGVFGLPVDQRLNTVKIWAFKIDNNLIKSLPTQIFTADSPTNTTTSETGQGRQISSNYCTLNPRATGPTSDSIQYVLNPTRTFSTGVTMSPFRIPGHNPSNPNQHYKWFFEVQCERDPNGCNGEWYPFGPVVGPRGYNDFSGVISVVGIITATNAYNWDYNAGNSFYVADNGFYSNYTMGSSGKINIKNGSYLGFAFDRLANTIAIYHNGQLSQTITLGRPSNNDFFVFVGVRQNKADRPAGYDEKCYFNNLNFGESKFRYPGPAGFRTLNTVNLSNLEPNITSGSFLGNGNNDGPMVFTNFQPLAMSINGNEINFLQESPPVQRLANGFKVRSSSNLYNQPNVLNYFTVSEVGSKFKHSRGAVTVP